MSKVVEQSNLCESVAGDGGRNSRLQSLMGPASSVAAILSSNSPDQKANKNLQETHPEVFTKILLKKYGPRGACPAMPPNQLGTRFNDLNQRAPAPI